MLLGKEMYGDRKEKREREREKRNKGILFKKIKKQEKYIFY